MSRIVLDGVSKVYAGNIQAVQDLSLTIEEGEFMVLVGPSGCGKSTLLRMIAGLEETSTGSIHIGDRDVTFLAPRQRDIAMVFQNYALYPHMSVRRNIAFGLKVRKTPKSEIDARVTLVATMLGLEQMLERRPAALSGGQRQRVAMGRAIAREPAVYLMDEPLSNLDAKLRVGMRAELARLHERLGTTTVYVTHDQIEAMTLGQRVTVMRDGIVQQVGRPQRLYHDPANIFVAAFLGSPSMNLMAATVDGDTVEVAGERITLHPSRRPDREGEVVLGIRPSDLEDDAHAPPELPRVTAEVAVVEELGPESLIVFSMDATPFEAEEVMAAMEEGDQPRLLADDARSLFTAAVDRRTTVRSGSSLRLALDTSALHFFDPETGLSLRPEAEGDGQGGSR